MVEKLVRKHYSGLYSVVIPEEPAGATKVSVAFAAVEVLERLQLLDQLLVLLLQRRYPVLETLDVLLLLPPALLGRLPVLQQPHFALARHVVVVAVLPPAAAVLV